MRIFGAVLFGLAIAAIGIGMLRALGGGRGPHSAASEPTPMAPDVRITFWCETCGTELLLLRRGSESPPRHCGEPMTKREEVARTP